MNITPGGVYLQCPHCGHIEYCDAARAAQRLRELKMLRRDAEPGRAILGELLRQAITRLTCGGCGGIGLDLSEEDPEDARAWGAPVHCAHCQAVIPPERLEAFPNTRMCTSCQAKDEQGQLTPEHEYCPRCGDILQLRRRTTGLAGYRMVCPTCRK